MPTNPIKTMDRSELKSLVREFMQEIVWEAEAQLPDPDNGLQLRPEVAAYLQTALEENRWEGKPLDQVAPDLGPDD